MIKKIGYNINVLRQTVCCVANPITVGNFDLLFNFTPAGTTSDTTDGSNLGLSLDERVGD